jgi:signal peptidase I
MKKLMENKTVKGIINIVFTVLIVYAVLFVINLFLPYQSMVILTDSMTGVIDQGSFVVVRETDVENINEGDIIAFYADVYDDGEMDVVVHYLEEKDIDSNTFRTSPAVSDDLDPWILTSDDIIGTYAFKIDGVGRLLMFFGSTFGKIVLLVDIVVIYLLFDLLSSDKKDIKKVD